MGAIRSPAWQQLWCYLQGDRKFAEVLLVDSPCRDQQGRVLVLKERSTLFETPGRLLARQMRTFWEL